MIFLPLRASGPVSSVTYLRGTVAPSGQSRQKKPSAPIYRAITYVRLTYSGLT